MDELYIERIQIKNLWQQGNIDWRLKRDVNVLGGENGSGKTTILNFIAEALQPNTIILNQDVFYSIKEMNIHFNNNRAVIISQNEQDQWERRLFGLTNEDLKILNTKKISTFDIALSVDKAGTYNLLNNLLQTLRADFFKAQAKAFSYWYGYPEGSELYQKATTIRNNTHRFVEKINSLFAHTNKIFDAQEFKFKKTDQDILIDIENLSAGEKQLLLLLTSVLNQEINNTLLLLDEPEISLHINWQERLLSDIHELNPRCQLIVATHSPRVHWSSWRDHYQRVDTILNVDAPPITPDSTNSNTHREEFTAFLNDLRIHLSSFASNTLPETIIHNAIHFWRTKNISFSLGEINTIKNTLPISNLKKHHKTFLKNSFIEKSDSLNTAQQIAADTTLARNNHITYNMILKKYDSFAQAKEYFNNEISPRGVDNFDIVTFSTLLGLAQNSAEAQEVEALRSIWDIPASEQYTKKLGFKR